MLIGLLSDTHDRLPAMIAAVNLLRQRGAEFFIHCGDVGSEQILDQLAGLPAAFVFGNNDWDLRSLERYAQSIGVQCLLHFGDLELGGKRIAVVHGDDAKLLARILTDQEHDYLLKGHSHQREDRRVGRTRIINPGALHRALQKSVALLNTETDELTFMPVQ
ncbi:MAG TPA: YfcE family phosphodiesterase [Tepidisphaeraceae bacterium]|jgi:putative phosphoesterase